MNLPVYTNDSGKPRPGQSTNAKSSGQPQPQHQHHLTGAKNLPAYLSNMSNGAGLPYLPTVPSHSAQPQTTVYPMSEHVFNGPNGRFEYGSAHHTPFLPVTSEANLPCGAWCASSPACAYAYASSCNPSCAYCCTCICAVVAKSRPSVPVGWKCADTVRSMLSMMSLLTLIVAGLSASSFLLFRCVISTHLRRVGVPGFHGRYAVVFSHSVFSIFAHPVSSRCCSE